MTSLFHQGRNSDFAVLPSPASTKAAVMPFSQHLECFSPQQDCLVDCLLQLTRRRSALHSKQLPHLAVRLPGFKSGKQRKRNGEDKLFLTTEFTNKHLSPCPVHAQDFSGPSKLGKTVALTSSF